MNVRVSTAVAVLSLAAGTCTASAQSPAAVKSTLQELYSREEAAAMRKDATGVFAMYAPSYRGTDTKGRVRTLKQEKAIFQQVMTMASSISGRATVERVTLSGNEATVTVVEDIKLVVMNPSDPNKTARMVMHTRSRDTWQRSGSRWLLAASKDLDDSATLNGEPLRTTE